MVRPVGDDGIPQFGQRLLAAVGAAGPHAPSGEVTAQNEAVGRVVIDDQQPLTGKVGDIGLARRRHREGETEPEPGTHARFAAQADFAAHQLRQPAGDTQTQAGAAEAAAGGAVGLDEGLEQQRLLVGGDADAGVPDLETQQDTACFEPLGGHVHHHLAARGELDGVAHQIAQDLPQADRVALQQVRRVRRDEAGQFQALGVGTPTEHRGHVFHGAAQFEVQGFDAQLAGLQAGKIQNFVDQRQQDLGGGVGDVQITLP